MKKVLAGIAVVLVLFIGALVALPYFFKDEIVTQIKSVANENLTAKLDFRDVSLSLLRHFPKLSVGLEGLTITGSGPFEGIKLIDCERLDITVDLWSAIFGEQIIIKGVYLNSPKINIYVLPDGTANYDIAKPSAEEPETASTSSTPIHLDRYAIRNGEVHYDDRSLPMRADLWGLNHEGSGQFKADIYDLITRTDIEKLSVRYGGVQYLSKAKVNWKATLNVNMPEMKFTLRESDLQLNALKLALEGWFQMPNDTDYLMDLRFSTPQNEFKHFLSLLPGAYTQDFEGVQAGGRVQFSGLVRGRYSETTYPAFKIDLKIDNGSFKYPSLPLGVSGIFVDMSINSPSTHLNAMTVDIPRFALRIGSNPIAGRFFLKTPETNPTVDTKLTGRLNLAELSKAFPMESIQELAGFIEADLAAKASMQQIDAGKYEEVSMNGHFRIQDMTYRATGMPLVRINTLTTHFSPRYVEVPVFDARLGKSDLRASGRIDNILAYFAPKKTMTGVFNLRSAYFDANEWLAEEETGPTPTPSVNPETTEKIFDRWDFTVDGAIQKLTYEEYTLKDLMLKGHFTPNKMIFDNFSLHIGDSDLHGSGRLLNVWNYLFDNQTVYGALSIKSDYFDLNPFMASNNGAPAAKEAPVDAVFLVPENVDITLDADFRRIRYTEHELRNLKGKIVVRNGVAALRDLTADILGGQLALAGSYDTQQPAKPTFDVNLALQNMSFQETYQRFVTFKTLAPIAQYIEGKFNTTLTMNGQMGKDMLPDFNTLNAAGFIETLNAAVNNFKPLVEISQRLNLPYLSRLELQNTRNWFEIQNGRITLKPFTTQMRDVTMQIGGSHSIGSEMNYQILTKTPRKALEKTAVGSATNAGLRWVSSEAAKFGVNVAQGEYINVRFDIMGTLTNPKVAFKILPSNGERTIREEVSTTTQNIAQQVKDTLQTVATQKVEEVKKQAEAAAEKALDSAKQVATQKMEEAKEKAVQEVGKAVGEEAAKKAEEILRTEEAKKKLEEWNPLKKRRN
ncbi:MAG: AsmA family protein [Saprospiraceae bacterium]|nr:AsmA family protein [Saprospiraceae bacterium]MDW8484554.1 AsmA-like C-terminal region-containing protein [Saprospiraceae bacterium]